MRTWVLALCVLAMGCDVILRIPDDVTFEEDVDVDAAPDTPADAAVTDAGLIDAGPPADAGVQPDAPDIDWWNPDYPYRARLTLTAPNLLGPALEDVPVLVHVNAGVLPYIADTADTGLRFVTDDDNTLAHEVETWDPAGESYLWVKIPTVDGGTSLSVWLYYGAPADTAVVNREDVWNSDYLAVWHLAEPVEDGGNVDGIHEDSTSNHHDGDQTRNGPASGPGIIGGAQDFDGNNDWIRVPTQNGLEEGYSEMTMIARVFLRPTIVNFPHIVAAGGQADSGRYRQFFWQRGNDGWAARYRAGGNDPILESETGAFNQWSVLAMIYDGSAVRLYLNGQYIGDPESLSGNLSPITSFHIGSNPNADADDLLERDFDGLIDELRVSTTARSSDWLLIQTLSMNEGLITYGANECLACP